MKAEETCACLICGTTSGFPLDSHRETFRPTLTLERTLETLCKGMLDPKFDIRKSFEVLTRVNGNFFCSPCLSVLHMGMRIVSEIMRLEERVQALGERIEKTVRNSGCEVQDKRIKDDCIFKWCNLDKDESGESEEINLYSDDDKDQVDQDGAEGTDCESIKTDIRKPRYIAKAKKDVSKRKNDQDRKCLRRSSRLLNPKSQDLQETSCVPVLTVESKAPLKQKLKLSGVRLPGVQKCPSCDFIVDIRSPAEKKSTETLPLSVRENLRRQSKSKLDIHFRDTHMPAEAKTKFQYVRGKKIFLCLVCTFNSNQFSKVVGHYMSIHVCPTPSGRVGPPSVSCPIKGCSFVSVAVQPGEVVRSKNSQRYMKEMIASHVYKEHDLPDSRLKKFVIRHRDSTALCLETDVNQKEYRCTRCDYRERLSENISRPEYTRARAAFLKHFYDAHLKNSEIMSDDGNEK